MYDFSITMLTERFGKSKMTYRELAAVSGVTTMTIHRLFNKPDTNRPRIDHLVMLCNALGVSPRSLFKKEA